MDWLQFILAMFSGLAAAIPLVLQLIRYVKAAVKERNWSQLLQKVTDLMKLAESKFKVGSERKEWVMMMVKASADSINYDVDYDAISEMIDHLCDLSKVINPPKESVVTTDHDR